VALGAGRAALDDSIDPGVGIEIVSPVGAAVRTGEPVLRLHHRGGRGLSDAVRLLDGAVSMADASPSARPIVVDRVHHREGTR
jgi:pyrimidine-nucleoside phosphorylase/thymidine phosphorylase